jgi:hypothetical protein
LFAAVICIILKADPENSIAISTLCLMMNLEIFVEYLVYRTKESDEDLVFCSVKSHHLAHAYLAFCWIFIGDRGVKGTACYMSVLLIGWLLKAV